MNESQDPATIPTRGGRGAQGCVASSQSRSTSAGAIRNRSPALASPRKSGIVYNPTLEVKTIDLEGNKYGDVQGNKISGNVTLLPFESRILIAADFETPSPALRCARQKRASPRGKIIKKE
jgi:hypothetical protein